MPNLALTKGQKIVFFAVAAVIFIILLMVIGVLPGLKKGNKGGQGTAAEITLDFWGIDNEDAFRDLISDYQNLSKNIKINYRQVTPENYEETLIDALASRRGPDVLMIRHNWLMKHFEKLYPIPSAKLSIKQLKEGFVDVAADDMVLENKIYGLPLYLDTLALYWNKDLFNTAGIALAPNTWQDFQETSRLLTEKSLTGEIKKSGAALGTAANIDNAPDILSILMLQAGSQITDEKGTALFDDEAGRQALNFYTSFSNPASLYYCWNNNLPDSLEAFSQGKVAMIIDYSLAREKIKNKNPYLNYAVSPLPQAAKNPDVAKNYADYWVLSASAASQYPSASWDFIFYLVDSQQAQKYLANTGKPPASRIIIKEMLNDEKIGVFAKQTLSAKSWRQIEPEKNRQIFTNMIESVVSGRLNIDNALRQAAEEINKLAPH